MELELQDYQITINGFVSRCHCKCKHCLLCSGDEKIKQVPFEKLKQLTDRLEVFGENIHYSLLDYKLQNSIPSIIFLSETYGNKGSTMLFDFRSILWKWADMYFYNKPKLDKSLLFSALFIHIHRHVRGLASKC
ncbi:MAG TPA: hypothetical protein VJ083_01475 [Sedimentibacter sp.]|nr:hypothetical protein [Sedimentibacter sp.]